MNLTDKHKGLLFCYNKCIVGHLRERIVALGGGHIGGVLAALFIIASLPIFILSILNTTPVGAQVLNNQPEGIQLPQPEPNSSPDYNTLQQPQAPQTHQVAQSTQEPHSESIRGSSDDMSCGISITGWIICTASRELSRLTDGMFIILKTMLHIEPLDRSTTGGDRLYEIWSSFRDVANVIFIILFLIVIWSHLTGAGLSNYNIKRILPRLVANIILVNASYYIGLLIVDVTNILGVSLKSVLDEVARMTHTAPALGSWSNVAALSLGVAAAGVFIYIFAFSFLPLAISALISFLIVVIILVARQAIIIMLIVISPIAFSLNVLPNTQKWFSRWWTAMISASMVYPIIAIVYGGSSVIANIIRSGATGSDVRSLIIALIALAAEVLPFFVVPRLVKSSSSMLGQISRAVNKPNSGIFGAAQNISGGFAKRKQTERKINRAGSTKRKYDPVRIHARMEAKRGSRRRWNERQLSPGDETVGLTEMDRFAYENREDIAKSATKGIIDEDDRERRKKQIVNNILSRIIQLDITDVEAEEARIDALGLSKEDTMKVALSNDPNISSALRAAAFKKVASTGGIDDINALIEKISELEGDTTKVRMALANAIDASGVSQKAAHLNSTATASLRTNGEAFQARGSVARMYQSAATAGAYSPAQLSRESTASLNGLFNSYKTFSPELQKSINRSASSALGNKDLVINMSGESRRKLERFTP